MEDQQPDSGDLTTDAESPDQPADAGKTPTGKAARHRHRMPLRKDLTESREGGDEAAADEQPELEVAAVSEVAPAEAEAPTRRRGLFRRRTKAPEPETVSAPTGEGAESEEPAVPTDTDTDGTTEAAEAVAAPQEAPVLVPHRPAGKRLTIAAAAAGVVFVGAAAFAGATLEPYLADRALVHTKLDIAKTAANAITALWTYNPDNMEALPDRAAGYLGGDFANEYRKYIDAIVAPNKQAQVTNTTEVMGAAVESVTPTEATALVYTNSVATSPASKNIPSLRYLSYRLTLQRHDAKWLITKMSTVTSFDLTPQL
ncbi:mammalian cell entry protein [Mycolicibacterium moriokaense]|uniref:Mce-associated membrane protein n=1 Tax=Mycolicibacterium moriokaense TaxID=39691 RepID=A0A318HFH5_9MYCO|nr:mammalian cell entry protein [Mycolicibacterium moriokaense]PXX05144.1 Mce-associated membrane protein [Mycolicibacterium moriokaense]